MPLGRVFAFVQKSLPGQQAPEPLPAETQTDKSKSDVHLVGAPLQQKMAAPQRVEFHAMGQQFQLEADFEYVKELGSGAYGTVIAARNKRTGDSVAVKKVTKIFTKKILTKRALRELKLLHHFRGHKNITCLYDMDIIHPRDFQEVYLYEELMEADLHAIIRSGQPLSDAHFQSFIYQTLCGLKYIHSASVLHRDLKPGNLLVNADCELKIADFGLARGFHSDPEKAQAAEGGFMTEYVATRWYRAPEIMLSFQNYTTAIDIWSVGCILAELLGGKPIFKGRDYVDQLNQILNIIGSPSTHTIRRVGSPRAQEYLRSLPHKPGVPFKQMYPGATAQALDLLTRLLTFDPFDRISTAQALEHPYLAVWHDPSDEPVCPTEFDFSFESEDSTDGMRELIAKEVAEFRQFVRQPSMQPTGGRRNDSLPLPSRDELIGRDGPSHEPGERERVADGPVAETPSDVFEQELASATSEMKLG